MNRKSFKILYSQIIVVDPPNGMCDGALSRRFDNRPKAGQNGRFLGNFPETQSSPFCPKVLFRPALLYTKVSIVAVRFVLFSVGKSGSERSREARTRCRAGGIEFPFVSCLPSHFHLALARAGGRRGREAHPKRNSWVTCEIERGAGKSAFTRFSPSREKSQPLSSRKYNRSGKSWGNKGRASRDVSSSTPLRTDTLRRYIPLGYFVRRH